jgi:hypothetical protein
MSQPKQEDNLKLIKGVGTAGETRLRKAGIHSYASLASQTPETLGNLLGYPLTRQKNLQGWIEEAKRFTSKASRKQQEKRSHTDISNRQRYATFTLEVLLDHSDRVRRTQVVHVQSGEEKHWSSWDDFGLANYIVQKANIKQPILSKARKNQTNTKTVAIKDRTNALEFITPPTSDIPTLAVAISEVTISAQASRLHEQCSFGLSGSKAAETTSTQSRFVLEVLAFNLLTSQTDILTTCEGVLQSDQLEYSMSMLFPAPKIGRYLLETIVLLPEADAITVHRGPFLTMIP